MNSTAGTAADRTPVNRRLTFAAAIALAALSVFIARRISGSRASSHSPPPVSHNRLPERRGTRSYAPTQATSARQVNRPLGSKAADRIARKLGLNKQHAFTAKQYKLFVSGKGVGGDPAAAKLVDESVRILTNTTWALPSIPTSMAS